MERKHDMKENRQRGSATVEAVVGFTVFLFAIFTILGLANFCRAQMVVSSAVDTAAKELSQYSYFYEMSGLKKFDNVLQENGQVGKNNINEVIGTVDALYSSVSSAKEQTVQEKTNVENMLAAGEVDLQTFDNAIANIENSAEGIVGAIGSVENAIGNVSNDPMVYMRSIVALLGAKGSDAAKRAIAVPLAKSFVSRHLTTEDQTCDEYLESLGIEGGMSSMNFNLSKVFTADGPEDITLTVFYKVKLLQVFEWVVLEANVSKVATCRAWLGGDHVIVRATAEDTPTLGSAETTKPEGESNAEDPSEPAETTDPTDPTEPTEPTSPPVDTTGSYWYLGDGGYGTGDDAGVSEAFRDDFLAEYNVAPKDEIGCEINYVPGRNPEGEYTGYAYMMDFNTNPSPSDINMEFVMGDLYHAKEQMDEGLLPKDTKVITYVLYVPENIPDEDYQELEQAASQAKADYASFNMLYPDENYPDLIMDIQIVKGGGNYDYGSDA